MSSVSALAQQLAVVAGFENPRARLEQYRTPPDLAARLVHDADLQGDIEDRLVLDLGTGTGMLALGAALRGPTEVVGLDIDPGPLGVAQANERRVGTTTDISWMRADATDAPLRPLDQSVTVVMNPPFGAQNSSEHADRAFLATAARVSEISYSIHNAGSEEFVDSFVADNAGDITRKFRAELNLPRQFDFHDEDSRSIDAEIFRIEWH